MSFHRRLEGVVAAETILSAVESALGRPIVRGHRPAALAGHRSLEWPIGALWRDFVPRDLFDPALPLEALKVPRDAFTGVSAVSRVCGLIAHAREQIVTGGLIRQRSRHVGVRPIAA